jgi:hypothetical protein
MNKLSQPVSNLHYTPEFRFELEPDLRTAYAHYAQHNFAVTKARDLDRYKTAYSDRTNIFDNARTVEPSNYFGIKHANYIDPTPHYSPAGMDYVNSRVQTGNAFTKPFKKQFPANL